MQNPKVKLVIVGEIPCVVCGAMMSQKDVDNQEAIASINPRKLPFCDVVAHVNHFYDKDKDNAQTPDYRLNLTKFTLAAGRDNGLITTDGEKRALALIAELEAKLTAEDK